MSLSSLLELTSELPAPAKPSAYFEGRPRVHLAMVDDVLVFTRQNESELRRRSAESHLHKRFVLVSCLQTEGTLIVDGVPTPLEPGEAQLVFPQSYHYFTKLPKRDLAWLFITFDSPEPEKLSLLRLRTRTLTKTDFLSLETLSRHFLDTKNQNAGDAIALELSQLLYRWCAELGEKEGTEISSPTRRKSNFWQRFQQELDSLPPEELRVEPLAKRLTVSERHLRDKFQQQYEVSIGTYLRNYRIRRAIALLSSSELTLAEIADRCGYRSVSSFCHAFKEQTGTTPSNFRGA